MKTVMYLVTVGAVMVAGAAYANTSYDSRTYDSRVEQRDPKMGTNTTADCVHGATGIAANMDCTRNRADRNTNDLTANSTDTGRLNGSRRMHSDMDDHRASADDYNYRY